MSEKYKYNSPCKECGGTCCKSMGCHYSPEDFEEISYEYLDEKMQCGYISIDAWEGNPTGSMLDFDDFGRYYFLRTRNVNSDIVDFSWGGQCVLLTENGCRLTFDERPKGGRELVALDDHRTNNTGCRVDYSKQQCAIDWMPYQEILMELVYKYNQLDLDVTFPEK